MKCPFNNESDSCRKKYAIGAVCFAMSVIAIALLVKLAAWVLGWFSSDLYLNTVIVMFSTVVTLIACYVCCCKHQACCDKSKECGEKGAVPEEKSEETST